MTEQEAEIIVWEQLELEDVALISEATSSNSYSNHISKAIIKSGEAAINYCVDKGFLAWYVITNNTSWCNVEKAIHSGPFSSKKEAIEHCKFNGFLQSDRWVELLSPEEAQILTY